MKSEQINETIFNFFKKVNITGSCWLWRGGKTSSGYGWYNGTKQTSHRYAFKLFFTEIPDDVLVCHKCDVKTCVNPQHLFLGTHQDNSDDMYKKDRQNISYGESHGNAKYTYKKIKNIRKDYEYKNYSQKELSKKYNMPPSTIHKIVRNKSREKG